MIKCVIAIPVYQVVPSIAEQRSFEQALKILGNYRIALLTYRELDTSYYEKVAHEFSSYIAIEYFDKKFFDSLQGYNSLCLSLDFYERFSKYDYMLIYQLDAYVFRDELEYWCNKGYDYIGAPWFEENKSYEVSAKLWAVGNGGFSLRKVSTFIQLFESKQLAYCFKYLYKKTFRENKGFLWLLKAWNFKFENNFSYLLNNWNDAEDLFYCLKLADTNYRLKIPDIKTAVDFAFEQSPKYLFSLNGNKLPFGCHAWEKYEYDTFWKKYI